MIATTDEPILEDCLRSIHKYVDEINVVIDAEKEVDCPTKNIVEAFGGKIVFNPLNYDFASQRNLSFGMASDDVDWILWLDADDYVPEKTATKIREIADQFKDSEIDGFMMDYYYEFDNNGIVNTVLKRERLLRKKSNWKWKYEIHEVCILEDKEKPIIVYLDAFIEHRKQQVIKIKKNYDLSRNLKIIEKVINKYLDDPRMLYYAGNEYFTNNKLDEAAKYYKQVVEIDKWKEQRYLAAFRLAAIAYLKSNFKEAQEWLLKSIDIDYTWAESYCLLGDIALQEEDYKKAIHFYRIAANTPLPSPERILTYNPSLYTWYPLLRIAYAAEKIRDYKTAIECTEKVIKDYFPDDKPLLMELNNLRKKEFIHRHDNKNKAYILASKQRWGKIRQEVIKKGLELFNIEVKIEDNFIVNEDELNNTIMFFMDSSNIIYKDTISKLREKNVEVILDISDIDINLALNNSNFLEILKSVSLVITNSCFYYDKLKEHSSNIIIIDDSPVEIDQQFISKNYDEKINILVSINNKRESLEIIPLIQEILSDKIGKIKFIGSSRYVTNEDIDYKEYHLGICYYDRSSDFGVQAIVDLLAHGIPVLTTGSSTSIRIIDHGKDGFISYIREDWERYLTLIKESPDILAQMAQFAYLKARFYTPLSFINKIFSRLFINIPSIDIIIPCHGNARYLEKCLNSIQENAILPYKVIVVANPYEEEEVRNVVLKQETDRILYYPRRENSSFAENCNYGFDLSDARYVVFLHSDTIVTPGWDVNLIEHLKQNNRTLVASYSNSEYQWIYDVPINIAGKDIPESLDLEYLQNNNISIYDIYQVGSKINQENKGLNNSLPWLDSGCLAVSRSTFREVGYFDERLGNVLVEADYCRRLNNIGGKCLYCWDAFVFHFKGKSIINPEQIKEIEKENIEIIKEKEQLYSKKIKFFVGETYESWTYDNIDEKGLGGSETCAAIAAKYLSYLGWNVEFYGNVPEVIYRDGVKYIPYQFINLLDHSDVFISLRICSIFDYEINSTIKILYNQDTAEHYIITPSNKLTPKTAENIDYFFMVSRWQKEQYQEFFSYIPQEKFYVTRSGIERKRFDRFINGYIPKDPKRFVYNSSADRGLETLLLCIWPKLYELDNEMQLHVYYGFNTWLSIIKKRGIHSDIQRIENIIKIAQQPGVFLHGRVGQKRLVEENAMANMWLYPTHFTETFCITALDTAGAGVLGITSPLAALLETAPYAEFISGDPTTKDYQQRFFNKVIEKLQTPDNERRIQAIYNVYNNYDWKDIAQEWSDFFIQKIEEKNKMLLTSKSNYETDVVLISSPQNPWNYLFDDIVKILNENNIKSKRIIVCQNEIEYSNADLVIPLEKVYENISNLVETKNIIITDWLSFYVINSINKDVNEETNKINIICQNEVPTVGVGKISAMMNDLSWKFVFLSEQLARSFIVPGTTILGGANFKILDQYVQNKYDKCNIGIIFNNEELEIYRIIEDVFSSTEINKNAQLIVLSETPEKIRKNEKIKIIQPKNGTMFSREELYEYISQCGAWIFTSPSSYNYIHGIETIYLEAIPIISITLSKFIPFNEYNSIVVTTPYSRKEWQNIIEYFYNMPTEEKESKIIIGKSTIAKLNIEQTTQELINKVLKLKR